MSSMGTGSGGSGEEGRVPGSRWDLFCLGVKVRQGDLESGSFLILSPGCFLGRQAGRQARQA